MKKVFSKLDKPLLIITILLCCIGLLMVFSSSSVAAILRYDKSPTYFFIRQLIFFVVAFTGGFFIINIPTKWYKSVAWLAILGIIGVLTMLLLYGTITNHVQSWFYIPGGIAIQPSEFAKSFLIIFMACFYNNLVKKKVNNVYLYFVPLSIALLIGVLIMMQPDFGSAAILMAIGFCIFISIPMVKNNITKILMILGVGFVILGVVLLYSGAEILNSDQMERFKFQNPCQRYKEDTGYQVCNGYIAINNGGLFGVGIGKSTQKYLYLPESHTDFIFAILVEELGLLAGLGVLVLYGLLLYRLLKIAKEAYVLRNSILAYGTFWYFTFHIIINLCGMLSILPLTGVPLPLLSYGGSSTLNFIAMLFITQRVAIENKTAKYNIELKKLAN